MEVSADPKVSVNLAQFGLGTVRTLAEYERYADVDLRRQVIGPAAKCGRFAPHPAPASLASQRIFTRIFDDNAWKSWETRSGSGSTLLAAHALASGLAQLFVTLQIRTLVDAGCGDVNWLAGLSAKLDGYFGVDIVEHLAVQNNRLLGHRPGHFFKTLDVARDTLPKVDTILCRNVLSHLSNADIAAALGQFAKSGATWLLATMHDGVAQNQDTSTGVWRPVDLTAAPFLLPAPQHRIQDGKGRWLGVWRLP